MFINASQKRLRSGWRILIFLFLFWGLASVVLLIRPLFGDITKRQYLEAFSPVIVTILAIAATIAVATARKFLDKRPFQSLGLGGGKKAWHDLLFGFALSGGMAALFLLILLASGLVEVVSLGASFSDLAPYGPMFSALGWWSLGLLLFEHVLVGYWEELVFRGYLFRNMTEGMGLTLAVVVSCVVYGLIHAANPNAGLLSTIIIVFFGFLRIYGLLLTRLLWLSMGMHIGWNFFQGPVLGFGASGHQMPTLLDLQFSGPEWATGGAFGPEGSLLILPVLGLAIWAMHWWSGQRSVKGAIAI